jgi:hypothetical protein
VDVRNIKFPRPVLLRLAFLLCLLTPFQSFAALKIAIVDTGFCSKRIKTSASIVIAPALDMTNSVKLNCDNFKDSDLKTQGRFHGHLVLEEFLKYLPKESSVTIFPLTIYNGSGKQTIEAWDQAIAWIKKENIDLVLTASGLIGAAPTHKELPALWFIPSGRIGGAVKEDSTLFPQSLAPKENIFVIGDFMEGKTVIYDQGLLYKDVIDYSFASGESGLTGTSRTVAHALGRAIDVCSLNKKMKSPSELRQCLSKIQKNLYDAVSKKSIKTF